MIEQFLDELDDKLEGSEYEVAFSGGHKSVMIELIYEQEIIMVGEFISGEMFGFGLPLDKKHHEMAEFVKSIALKMECESND